MRRAGRTAAATLLVAVLGAPAACDGAPPAPRQPTGSDAPSAPTRAAPELPPCPSVPAGREAPPGLTLPPGATVVESTTDGPLTTARGFVPLDPVAVHGFYDAREELELVSLEEEGFEAEVLYGDDERRVYVKARIVCEGGSAFTAVVGDRGAAADVPTPAGTVPPRNG